MLIDDLLELARISRTTLRADWVDLSALAAEVAADLRRAHSDHLVTADIGEALQTRGDGRGLRSRAASSIGDEPTVWPSGAS